MIRIFDRNIKELLEPKWWLVIVAIPHTIFSAIVPLVQSEVGSDYFTNATFGLLNSVVLVSIFLFTTGRSQARMVAVTASAVFLWLLAMIAIDPANGFDFSAELAPPFLYKFSINLELAPPLILWALLALSGLLHWNRIEDQDEPLSPSNPSVDVDSDSQSDQLHDLLDLVKEKQG
jgi:hypothetical protein